MGEDEYVCENDIQHYYDDFLIVGPPNSNSCELGLDTCLHICDDLGVLAKPSKIFCPATCLLYLGLLFNTLKLESQLPEEKQQKVLRALSTWDNKRWGRKCELLSLIGLLQHCTQAIPIGHSFLWHLIDCAHSVRSPSFHEVICLGKG